MSFDAIFRARKLNQPNELQKQVAAFAKEPGLYLVEAPMGLGKTEAALFAAYDLLCAGHHLGLYFALPTQVISDRIHERVAEFAGCVSELLLTGHVLPTRVGMVRGGRMICAWCDRSPLSRGDGPLARALGGGALPFSPRAWGWSADAGRDCP